MAVLFNAHADRLYNGSLPVANGSYTVCMWVKPRTGSGQHEFFFESDASGTTYCLASNNGVLGILNAGGGFVYNVTLGAAMTEDVWYFVAMTINGTTGNLYRGTESTAVTNASGTVATQGSRYRVYIGSDGSSSAYPCFADIAHVRMWNAILSESELNAERESATAVRTSNISAEWRMVDAAGKLTDSSGQSHPLVASSTGPWADASDPSFGTTVTGTIAVTLGATTSAATGLLVPVGTSAVTLGATTSAATGLLVPVGTSSVSLGATTCAGAGEFGSGTITGTVAASLGATTSAATGLLVPVGTSAVTLGATTCAGAGEFWSGTITGAVTASLGATTSAATGLLVPVGTSAVTLGATTSVGVGLLVPVGTSSVSLGATTCAGAGAHGAAVSGALSATLFSMRCWGAGYFGIVPTRYVLPSEVSDVVTGASVETTVVTLEVA